MIIIAFAKNTSKWVPRIFCRHFYHCAVIVPMDSHLMMFQFIRPHRVVQIPLRNRDIQILRTHGWHFVYVGQNLPDGFNPHGAKTCVDLARRALGMSPRLCQTPYGLYKYLMRHIQ